jgi:Na+-transporting NADH:ubiquinone oxidoreductase subunit A
MIERSGKAGFMRIRIRQGLDVPIDGAPEATAIEPANEPRAVALLGADYVGLEPRLQVQVGDRVTTGQPLIASKRDPAVVFPSPGTGVVAAIHRGARRVLKSVVVDLDGDPGPVVEAPVAVEGTPLRMLLLKTGLWTAFRTRPFSRVPGSDAVPGSIFVTAMDTNPLAGDPAVAVASAPEVFERGLDALSALVPGGTVHLCTGPDWAGPVGKARHAVFDGPHPAGLPGTHIHHLDPVGADYTVWHIGCQDVIAIGRLLSDGVLSFERLIALGGNGFRRPRLARTRLGADLATLLEGELIDDPVRIISGSVLSGREAAGSEAFLGRYHLQVSAVRQPPSGRTLRWRRLFDGRFSFAGTFARSSGRRTAKPFTTDQNGRATALVPIDAFERLMPLDVLTEPLVRALLIGDTDQAQALGALELDEEDLALCSFICPGKNDYGSVLRVNLDQIEREG